MKPESITLREQLELRDGRGCFYCSATGKPLRIERMGLEIVIRVQFDVDHVLPRALGGCEHLQNKVWSCRPCNAAKADTEPTLELWRPSVTARLHVNCCGEIAANRWDKGLPVLTYPIR